MPHADVPAGSPRPQRFGFPVKVLGQPGLKSNDSRRWQSGPHLKVSLEYLHAIFAYLGKHNIHMYRMSSDIAPYATHPDMPQFHGMIRESTADLAALGKAAREQDIRLSFHPSQYVILNSPDPALTAKSVADLVAQAEMLDLMELGPEACLVIHVGGAYGDRYASCRRWSATFPTLPEPVRRRLVLENDDIRFSAGDVLSIHEETGVRLIFDHQHYWCMNPERLDLRETVAKFLATWPADVRPKIHYSSPRTEFRQMKRKVRQPAATVEAVAEAPPADGDQPAKATKAAKAKPKAPKFETVTLPPIWTGHADFVNPFEFATFLRIVDGLRDFDVMIEAKAKDLALRRTRLDLPRYAPEFAPRFGLDLLPTEADDDLELRADAAED